MKRIGSFLLVFLFIFSFSSIAFAAKGKLLPIKSDPVTIELAEAKSKKVKNLILIPNSKTFIVGEKYEYYINISAVYEDGSIEYLNSKDVKTTSSNPKVVKVVNGWSLLPKSPGKAEIVVTYKGLKGKVAVKVKPATKDQFSVYIPNIENFAEFHTEFYYANYFGSSKTDYYYKEKLLDYHFDKKNIVFTGLNWDQHPKLFGTIVIDNRIYHIEVMKKDNKKTIALNPKSLTEVKIKYPKKDLMTKDIDLTKMDSNKIPIPSGSFFPFHGIFFIQKGTYNIHLEADNVFIHPDDPIDIYSVFLKNYKVNKKKQVISIKRSHIALVDFSINHSAQNNLEVESLFIDDYANFYFSGGLISLYDEDYPVKAYISKRTYGRIAATVLVNNNWNYVYNLQNNKLTDNVKTNIGDQLTANFSLNENTPLYTNERIYLEDFLNITDQFGNKIENIFSESEKVEVQGVLVFKGNKKTYRIPLNDSYINLPNQSGTYEVSFEVEVKKK